MGDFSEQRRRGAAACAWPLCMEKQKWSEDPLYQSQVRHHVATRRFGLLPLAASTGDCPCSVTAVGFSRGALPDCKAWHEQWDDNGAWHITLFIAVLLRLHDVLKAALDLSLFPHTHPFQLLSTEKWPASDSGDTGHCQRPGPKGSSITPSHSWEYV